MIPVTISCSQCGYQHRAQLSSLDAAAPTFEDLDWSFPLDGDGPETNALCPHHTRQAAQESAKDGGAGAQLPVASGGSGS